MFQQVIDPRGFHKTVFEWLGYSEKDKTSSALMSPEQTR